VNDTPPEISIVIPVYNEEAILFAAVAELHERLRDLGAPYEIVLCENGSRDRTLEIAADLESRYREVRHLSIGEPNYGRALRMGMIEARGTYVMCDEIDLGDVDFHGRALKILRAGEADLVVGSKAIAGARDERPWLRHLATLVINLLLRVMLGFRGTDTHGLKAFRRERLLPTARRCLVEKDLFASEFVIRAQREGLRLVEIPVRVIEKRRPSVNLLRRVPNVLKNLIRLFVAIRLRGSR
jgi:glycosyltransferase involved in cell wall biosynthesis